LGCAKPRHALPAGQYLRQGREDARRDADRRLEAWRHRRRTRQARRDPCRRKELLAAMRGLFRWLVESGLVADDPTTGVAVVRAKTEGFPVWDEQDEARFRARWPLGTRERVAFEVLRQTGLRRGDAVRVGRPHVKDSVIRLATEKTGERIAVAMSAALVEAIAAGPVGDLTFIATATGLPMTKESFGNWFRDSVKAAGVAKSAHGLRKAAATADALAGWSDAELDSKFGWRGRKMASLYTESANRERLSLAAARRTEGEQEVPHLVGKAPSPLK
jgi:integrase